MGETTAAAQASEKLTITARLAALVKQRKGEPFHDSKGTAYISLEDQGHRMTWQVDSPDFKKWLRYSLYKDTGLIASDQNAQEAVDILSAQAAFDGPTSEVHVRIAGHGGKVYLDLGDDHWRAVEIDAAGWQIVERSPVRFRRSNGMLALPDPVQPPSAEAGRAALAGLGRIVNMGSQDSQRLMLGWLLGSLMPAGPYPVLVLHGEHGSGKSTTARGLRSLVDPHSMPLRAVPRGEGDLALVVQNNWVLAFDNISEVRLSLNDSLAQISTGAGFGTRKLYTNTDETMIYAARPILLNGIAAEMIGRPDLLNRSLVLELPSIERRRITEVEIQQRLAEVSPLVLGALLDAVSSCLRNRNKVKLTPGQTRPRMLDFTNWVEGAAEYLGWTQGQFTEAFCRQQDQAAADSVQGWPVLVPLQTLLGKSEGNWEGTMGQLQRQLSEIYGRQPRYGQWGWPGTPRKLSEELARHTPALRSQGIEVRLLAKGNKGRRVQIVCRHFAGVAG